MQWRNYLLPLIFGVCVHFHESTWHLKQPADHLPLWGRGDRFSFHGSLCHAVPPSLWQCQERVALATLPWAGSRWRRVRTARTCASRRGFPTPERDPHLEGGQAARQPGSIFPHQPAPPAPSGCNSGLLTVFARQCLGLLDRRLPPSVGGCAPEVPHLRDSSLAGVKPHSPMAVSAPPPPVSSPLGSRSRTRGAVSSWATCATCGATCTPP